MRTKLTVRLACGFSISASGKFGLVEQAVGSRVNKHTKECRECRKGYMLPMQKTAAPKKEAKADD